MSLTSISSIKIMHGEIFLANVNRALTLMLVSPTYFLNRVDGVTHRNRAFAVPARARTNIVFPQPGGPYNKTPGGLLSNPP